MRQPMSSQTRTPTKKIVIRALALVIVLLIGGAIYDLYYPRTTQMREFNPDEVARLENAMWRSYYEKQRMQLFNQLAELLRTQYGLSQLKSNQIAYYGANAAFVFKQVQQLSDYEKTLPVLLKYYGAIPKMSNIPFEV